MSHELKTEKLRKKKTAQLQLDRYEGSNAATGGFFSIKETTSYSRLVQCLSNRLIEGI